MHLTVFSGLMLLILLILSEAAVRWFGLRPAGLYTNIRYENDPISGPWAVPNQVSYLNSSCFEIKNIHINSFGMRDRERSLAGTGRRVALTGDSFLQGLQVRDGETVSRRLESLFEGRVEVLNFGVSSTGTSVQLLLYRKRVRVFNPAVVLVMFYVGNDVSDNHPALKLRQDPLMAKISPYFLLDNDGRLKKTPDPGQWRRTSPVHRILEYTILGRWAYQVYVSIKLKSIIWLSGLSLAKPDTEPEVKAKEHLYEQAWQITEQVLQRFHKEVTRDKGHFGLVIIPSGMQSLGESGRVNSKTKNSSVRLRALARRAGFPVLDLSESFQDRVRSEGPTEFSHSCDGHWNPRGHSEAASAIYKFLVDLNWLR